MIKLRFDNAADAIYRSAQEAERKGCDMLNTLIWWAINRDDIGYYLEIDPTDTVGLSTEEVARLED